MSWPSGRTPNRARAGRNRGPRGALACAAVWLAAAIGAAGVQAQPAALAIAHRARSLQPGEVVVLTVESPRPLRELRVRAFERAFPGFQAGDPLKWSALIGIDLDTKPGPYAVEVSGLGAAGEGAVTAEYPLVVSAKAFRTRSLTVAAKYVSPPVEVMTRIREESDRVRGIFEAVSPDRHWTGRFTLPVRGRAISEFGKRSVYNGEPRSPHGGTDFAGATGTPIKAPNAGKVVLAANLYFSGNTVILDHGLGLYSYFGHMSAFSAREGEMVAAGQVVGKVGATGVVTGPHLHWTVRLAGTRVDPLSLVEALKPPAAPAAR